MRVLTLSIIARWIIATALIRPDLLETVQASRGGSSAMFASSLRGGAALTLP
jgi:hypothetical protein